MSAVPLLKRLATAVIAIPLLVWLVTAAPGWAFALVLVAFSALAILELARMFEHAGRPVHKWLGMGAGAAVTASFMAGAGPASLIPGLVLALAVGLILGAAVWRGAPPATEPAANTLLGVMYVGWLLGHGILLHGLPEGAWLVLFLVGVTWTGETAAYLVGSTMGRHKLAPVISPGKTLEGGAAQVVVSLGAAAALGGWLLPGCPVAILAGAGLLLGVVGQVGDLAESVIKRSVGTKDTGALIPGHGGVLDRFDSLLFNIPAFYFYAVYTGCGG